MSSRSGKKVICGGVLAVLVGAQGAEGGVGQLTAQQAQGLSAGLADGELLVEVVLAGADAARLGAAIVCRAQLTARLPPRFRRTRTVLPDHTGIGAVPVNRA